MKNLYALHKTYIWQNLKNHPAYNGCEVIVIGNAQEIIINGKPEIGQQVDETYQGKKVAAFAGQLRLKDVPSGEKSVTEMFDCDNLTKKEYIKDAEMV